MTERIPKAFLDVIRARLPLAAFIGKRVKLTSTGREFIGLSPFKDEKTPSFTVNEAKGFYHCFASGKHGDAIQFLRDLNGMSFLEAVQTAAREAGVPWPADRGEVPAANGAVEACRAAAEYFERALDSPEGEEARRYLACRGTTAKIIRQFNIGWAPENPALDALVGGAIDRRAFRDAGLLTGKARGVPLFRARVMFSIRDRTGVVVGFGGRRLEGGVGPKYLNSPETGIFRKSQCLFNFGGARAAAVKAGRFVCVEGYFDATSMAHGGFPETVSTAGTAVSVEQIQEMSAVVRERIFLFDGDRAGRLAAQRALLRALPLAGPGSVSRFAFLPDGEDPDSFIRTNGQAAMEAVLANAVSLEELLWKSTLAKYASQDCAEQRAAIARELRASAELVKHEETREFLESALARKMHEAFGPPLSLRPYLGNNTY